MSVLIITKITGDVEAFRAALVDRAEEFEKVSARGRAAGAIHHRFGVGDGHILVVDEWESAEDFHAFFGDPKMQEFVASVGAAPVPPEAMVVEAVTSSDQF